MEPLVSVIIPIYNTAKYLKRCVDSVIQQNYKNLQIILVDDGSQDASPQICDYYKSKDSRVVVIHKENGGSSSARNEGIKIADGEFLVFVDSDDYVHRECIYRMITIQQLTSAEIVQCNMRVVFGNENEKKHYSLKKHYVCLSGRKAILDYRYKVSPCAKLYHKSLFENIKFPEGFIYEDEATYYRVAYLSRCICLMDEDLYCYFQSNNSITRNDKRKLCMDFIKVCEDRIQFFNERNELELEEKSYVRYGLTLILKHSTCITKRIEDQSVQCIYEHFEKIYPIVCKCTICNKERILFFVYHHCPNFTAKMISWMRRGIK